MFQRQKNAKRSLDPEYNPLYPGGYPGWRPTKRRKTEIPTSKNPLYPGWRPSDRWKKENWYTNHSSKYTHVFAADKPKKVLSLDQYRERNKNRQESSLSSIIDLLSDDEAGEVTVLDEAVFSDPEPEVHQTDIQTCSSLFKMPEVSESSHEVAVLQNQPPEKSLSSTENETLAVALYESTETRINRILSKSERKKIFRKFFTDNQITSTETVNQPNSLSFLGEEVFITFTDVVKNTSFSSLQKHTETWIPRVLRRTPQTESETVLALTWTSTESCLDEHFSGLDNVPPELSPSDAKTADFTADWPDDDSEEVTVLDEAVFSDSDTEQSLSQSQEPVSELDESRENVELSGVTRLSAAVIGPIMLPPQVQTPFIPFTPLISSGENSITINLKKQASDEKMELSGNDVPETPERPQNSKLIGLGSNFIKTPAKSTSLPSNMSCTDMDILR